MASVPVFCRDFWAERKKAPGGVERLKMASACALAIFSGRIILYFAFVALCGALQTHFHGKGRKGQAAFVVVKTEKSPPGRRALGAYFTPAL
ncbi:hypothetical protein [Faecalibacterium prausnitzii]|uniref:hypothetical protein n=1 Tax=Faecalibacterium prausnitzii TaxID=853 RepID=UPI000DE32DCB|nr:hypothetical protein [Faecalibacterium prausnitzii]AXB29956.1 hypothetical protein C4Q21_14130 [Faecalibacterium prausnitzii]